MATACLLQWVPESLRNMAVSAVVEDYKRYRDELPYLPESVQFDIYYKLYDKGRLKQLEQEFKDLDVMSRVLRINDKRHLLHHCFQAVMDSGAQLAITLAETYRLHCLHAAWAGNSNKNDKDHHNDEDHHYNDECNIFKVYDVMSTEQRAVSFGFALGGFLCDAGWLYHAETVMKCCLDICKRNNDIQHRQLAVECCVRLMKIRNGNSMYDQVEEAWSQAHSLIDRLRVEGVELNCASLYSEFSAYRFAKSQYEEYFHFGTAFIDAYKMCCVALSQVKSSLPPRVILDIFRHASKVCVVRREFKKAERLVKFAVQFAREQYGPKHHKYSDALVDFGFYLLNIDLICQAVKVYQSALDIRISVFGGSNLHVAIAHEDLAYCLYVHEYSSGKFLDAKLHAETAIDIINRILPSDHLLLASSKRVKALILEEIAIDSHNKDTERRLLEEAQELHLSSLMLAMRSFGENNVQTAKHYGNLGRLYQSMHRYRDAETMHLKAIRIKERLLGSDDYEVALSVGHLASLYNYDLNKHADAEQLYLRSIAIGRKLFGMGYSGLEYDYRGLLRLYHTTGDVTKAAEYQNILREWGTLRGQVVRGADLDHPLQFGVGESDTPCEVVVAEFFADTSGISEGRR